MPQTFQVLRCYKCLVFQVHQSKKSIKWECKLCGEKQSIKRHYGVGTGKDCRLHVQKLNSLRGEIDELKCSQMQRNVNSEDESDKESELKHLELPQVTSQTILAKGSKWADYVEEPEVLEDSKEPMHLGDTEVVLEIPKKRRKQFQKNINNSRSTCYTEANSGLTQNNHSCYDDNVNNVSAQLNEDNRSISSKSKIEVDNILSHSPIKEIDNFKPKVPVKKFVPPVLNKKSKWAQFADEEEQDETLSSSIITSQNDLKFSMCDDSDLDNVLDF